MSRTNHGATSTWWATRAERKLRSEWPTAGLWPMTILYVISLGLISNWYVTATLVGLLVTAGFGLLPRLTLTTNRIVVDRPLLTWWRGAGAGEVRSHRLSDVVTASLDGQRLTLELRDGSWVRLGPPLGDELAASFLIDIEEALVQRPTCRVEERTIRRLTPHAGRIRCPYCRDDLRSSEGRACSACGTLHHAECLAELGRCTTFGCAAAARRRAA